MTSYISLNILCFAILTLILITERETGTRIQEKRYFTSGILACMGLFFFDLIWGIFKAGYINLSLPLQWAVNMIYFQISVSVGYFWLKYIEVSQKSKLSQNFYMRLPFIILSDIESVLVLLSPFFHFIFSIDSEGNYRTGPLYFMHIICSFGYVCFGSGKAFINGLREKNWFKRNNYFSLSHFGILPVICLVIQMLYPGSAITCMGITMSILIIFTRKQSFLITIDELTRLNNRFQFENYIFQKMNSQDSKSRTKLFLSVADLDLFKGINDKFGHAEGDNALKTVADSMRKGCSGTRAFIARFGGDEFIMIMEAEDISAVNGIWDKIRKNIEKANENLPYKIGISTGTAEYRPEYDTSAKFLAAADEFLYEEKMRKKCSR